MHLSPASEQAVSGTVLSSLVFKGLSQAGFVPEEVAWIQQSLTPDFLLQDAEKHAFGPEVGTPINYGQYIGVLSNNSWLSLDLSWNSQEIGDQQSWQVGFKMPEHLLRLFSKTLFRHQDICCLLARPSYNQDGTCALNTTLLRFASRQIETWRS